MANIRDLIFDFIAKGELFSKNVAKAVNAAWAEGLFGFININYVKSSNMALEKDIIENTASYGMQLGQIVDALEVVIAHGDLNNLKDDEQKAIDKFKEMADKINEVKRCKKEPIKKERVINYISNLETDNPEDYQFILKKLRLRKV